MTLDDISLGRLRTVLVAAPGLVVEDSRREALAGSVAERMRLTGKRDLDAYLDLLKQDGSPELSGLIDEVTVQETQFFRNPPQVRALREYVRPELLHVAVNLGPDSGLAHVLLAGRLGGDPA